MSDGQISSTERKAQHYVPKFYLKGFTDRHGVLWVYERFRPIRKSKPKQEAHRPDYYTHVDTGVRDETAEEVLKSTESRVARVIRKLANPQYDLTPESAAQLKVFVAFMFVRVPIWRDYLNSLAGQLAKQRQLSIARDREGFHRTCSEVEKEMGRPFGLDCEELRQFILKGEFEIEQKSEAFNLGAMFTSAMGLLDVLRDFGYECLYAPGKALFMTSDSPVYTLRPDGRGEATIGMGFGWPGVEVYFPLNKRVCLRLKRDLQPRQRLIEEGHVGEINRLIMATATQYLYSSELYRRTARLFDERGCKVRPGKESFLPSPPSGHGWLFRGRRR